MKRPDLETLWYGRHPAVLALLPLVPLYCGAVGLRRLAYRLGIRRRQRLPVPVIVVGNVTVGGTGKTPLVAWLCDFLRLRGFRPGIVARGYGGRARHWPQQVRPDADPVAVGDEPVLLAQLTHCPVAVGPDRVAAARALLEHDDCDLILSDDGLQHYALGRDIEIAVLDGVRRLGNGFCLPAGPLREPARRLQEVDLIVTNGLAARGEYGMRLLPGEAVNLLDPGLRRPLSTFRGTRVHAMAGIGRPQRFFDDLRQAGLDIEPHAFPDHHPYGPEDLAFLEPGRPLLMTQKDAVKCRRFATEDFWAVPVTAELDVRFGERVLELLEARRPVVEE